MRDPQKKVHSENDINAFLQLIHGADKDVSFRTFDDKKINTRPAMKFTGQLKQLEPSLTAINNQGGGVFFVVNKGGQDDASITGVNAIFVDTDGAPLEPIVEALEPHCVVNTSPGKWHVYWLVDQDFPINQFKFIQKSLAEKFNCDPSICNLSRVMRLPGFLHQKNNPYPVRIDQFNNEIPRYSYGEINKAFGFKNYEHQQKSIYNQKHSITLLEALKSNPYSILDVENMLKFIEPWDYNIWFNIITILAEEYDQEARDLAVRWSRGDLLKDGVQK